MSENMPVLRSMQKKDVNRVYEIECTCFRTPWSKLSLAGELNNNIAHYRVLELDGVIIGYAGMWVLFEEAHITNVAIMPDWRNHGYGRLLMIGMMKAAIEYGASCMTLEVRETNFTAQRLYKRLDFVQNGFRPRYYTDTGEGAMIMWNTDIAATVKNGALQKEEK